MTTILGRVIDSETMLPIPFIAVDLYKDKTRVDDTHTDSKGKFAFYDVGPGDYTIIMQSPIHQPVRQDIKVEPEDAELNIEIKTVKIHLQ